ncbi:MAG: hypothetical protein AAB299_02040 [Thermodesulfobacteriota bacterium]
MMRYPRIILKKGRETPLRHGHPWVFSGAVAKVEGDPAPGDIVLAADSVGRSLGLGFFNTGDLGYLDEDGHLYVTGRAKDLVIIGGRNVYPQDVEQVVNQVSGVHAGRVVSFGVPMFELGTEGLVVLVESDEPEAAWDESAAQVRISVPARLDIDLADARVVPRGKLRKSTSGKLARGGNREWYLNGTFGTIPPTISTQE